MGQSIGPLFLIHRPILKTSVTKKIEISKNWLAPPWGFWIGVIFCPKNQEILNNYHTIRVQTIFFHICTPIFRPIEQDYDALNTCGKAPYSRPPTVGPWGPPNRPRRPKNGLKMRNISYFSQNYWWRPIFISLKWIVDWKSSNSLPVILWKISNFIHF